MYIFDLLFYGVTVISFLLIWVLKLVWKNKNHLITKLLCFVPLTLGIVHLVCFGLNPLALPVMLGAVLTLLFLLTWNRKRLSIIVSVLVCVCLALPIPIKLQLVEKNMSSMGYAQAFSELHKTVQDKYPLAQWKGIDMDEKYALFAPKFEAAEKAGDAKAYYIALREYVKSFPDGHCSLTYLGEYLKMDDELEDAVKEENVGASFGLTLIELDDGSTVAGYVASGSEAANCGIRTGTIITSWNGEAVAAAAAKTSLLWVDHNWAEKDNIKRVQYMLLTRGKQGDKATITYQNQDDVEKSAVLSAQNDQSAMLTKDHKTLFQGSTVEGVAYSILNEDHGYISITNMTPGNVDEMRQTFLHAFEQCKSKNVEDIIIDVRNNKGGYDSIGAEILGYLSQEEIFYTREITRSADGKAVFTSNDIISKPNYQGFDKDIVILANANTISAGEGFVYNAKKLNNVKTAGITGTNASFASIEKVMLMPGNYMVIFPQTACCDENGTIMIDSDASGVGGIKPDIRIPLNSTAVTALYQDGKDYELEYILAYLEK